MPHHCSRKKHRKRVASGSNSNTHSRRRRVMNSLKRLRNTLMRRSRSRRYNVVPESEPESNHTNGRDFRFNKKYARRGRFDHNTMNQYRYRRPLTRNHLQKYQGNISKSTIGKRRRNRTKKGFTAPSRDVLEAITSRRIPGFLI